MSFLALRQRLRNDANVCNASKRQTLQYRRDSLKRNMLISAKVLCVLPSRVVIAIRPPSFLRLPQESPSEGHPFGRRDSVSDKQNGCTQSPLGSRQITRTRSRSMHRRYPVRRREE